MKPLLAQQPELPLQDAHNCAHIEEWNRWRNSRGGRVLLEQLFRRAHPYALRYLAGGAKVSIKLIWELVRQDLKEHRVRKINQGCPVEKVDGYALNNNFHSHAARFLVDRRPQWMGMFEERG